MILVRHVHKAPLALLYINTLPPQINMLCTGSFDAWLHYNNIV